MEVIKRLGLGVRFLLEILALIILGYWGLKLKHGTTLKVVIGIGAPKARFRLSGIPFLFLELIVFGLPFVAFLLTEKTTLASLYGVMVILNLVFMKIWKQ
ncbi:hypothetical protein COJ85_02285 [Bacillus sp. AFS076308]|uniref:YrdB family protein n=1 Tax=unclassified Bacillus (in: firmicutes) TaxID=185979 RepID=UPI000BF82BA5|nr:MULTISPECIES: YrdB family protein [unclassified Bacillus (in: firmicutes)]PFO08952.1 hypothetical protein COJ85_02285 [Bacillus sp. AFS076308]PGV52456.1 hypothetical protein COD92_09645 [Bacillus sp. AFS037270]